VRVLKRADSIWLWDKGKPLEIVIRWSREIVKTGRLLVTTADDYGIGQATSKGILELASSGIVKNSVLLVNSPFANASVQLWQRAGKPMELGWHPCLTLDRPITKTQDVPTLVQPNGSFWRLGQFLTRLLLGLIRPVEIDRELRAQHKRFIELVGQSPTIVNSHHHVQVFEPVGVILLRILTEQRRRPYLRRIREPRSTLWHVPGAKIKRAVLTALGIKLARRQRTLPGNDELVGITNPPFVADPKFWQQWLENSRARVVELTCHPGHTDLSLVGRDCTIADGQLERRVHEFHLLHDAGFLEICRRQGFSLVSASQLTASRRMPLSHAA
jgi:predicted glycoside hydrolase/deacetylase ChbG (UPF0249 family)